MNDNSKHELGRFHEDMKFITSNHQKLEDEVNDIITNDDSRVGLPISNKFFETKES